MKATVLGPTALDVKAYTTEDLAPGKTSFGHIYVTPGGPARNMAENAARLGADCVLLSAVGEDFVAQALLRQVASVGVDTSRVLTVAGMRTSAFASFTDDRDAEPFIIYNRDVVQVISPDYVLSHIETLSQADCHLIHTDPFSLIAYAEARRMAALSKDIPVGFSVKAADINNQLVEALHLAAWVFMNRDEASVFAHREIQSERDAAQAVQQLLSRGPTVAVVTLGKRGCVVGTRDSCKYVGGVECDTVDHTGAGDAFIAGFAHEMLRTRDTTSAAIFASAAAAMTVTSEETVRSDLRAESVTEFARTHNYQVQALD